MRRAGTVGASPLGRAALSPLQRAGCPSSRKPQLSVCCPGPVAPRGPCRPTGGGGVCATQGWTGLPSVGPRPGRGAAAAPGTNAPTSQGPSVPQGAAPRLTRVAQPQRPTCSPGAARCLLRAGCAAAVAALPQSLVRGTCERRALSPASLSPRPAGSPQGGWGSRAGHLSRPRSSGHPGAPAALGGCGVCAGRGVPGALRRAQGGRGVGAARPPCTLQAPLSAGGLVLRRRRPLTLSWS